MLIKNNGQGGRFLHVTCGWPCSTMAGSENSRVELRNICAEPWLLRVSNLFDHGVRFNLYVLASYPRLHLRVYLNRSLETSKV